MNPPNQKEMSEPKITITSTTGWEGDYIKALLEVAEKLNIGKPFIKTGLTPLFKHKIEISFLKELEGRG